MLVLQSLLCNLEKNFNRMVEELLHSVSKEDLITLLEK